MQEEYVICIPSYKRENICNEKTLTTLKNNKISKDRVYIFVANKEEKDIYKSTLDKNKYNKIIVGCLGIVQQREFIEKYFKKGKYIVSMDDDIESIDLSLSDKFKNKSLNYFIKHAFKIIKKEGAYIWGVYPVFNPFFREPRKEITTTLNFIVGVFYGFINRPNNSQLSINITLKYGGQKDDVEKTIKYFILDGKVIRFNKIGFETKYYGSEGGLGTFEERLKPMEKSAKALKKIYPEFGDIFVRKNGMYEFKLKKLEHVPAI